MFVMMALVALGASAELQKEVTKVSTYMELQQAYRNGKNNILLTADIDMRRNGANEEFEDFIDDDYTKACVFKDGVFDGGGHAIRGLKYYTIGILFNTTNKVALFREAKNSTFKNVKLEFNDLKANDYVAALVCAAYNCHFEDIFVDGFITGSVGVGGIVSLATDCTFKKCISCAVVEGSAEYAGGIAARTWRGKVENCWNFGNVFGDDGDTGGIVGRCIGTPVNHCRNQGEIKGNYNGLGGIVGHAEDGSNCTDCINDGAVTNTAAYVDGEAGGIVGITNSDIINCVNNAPVAGGYEIGGIAGYAGESSQIKACYSHGDAYGTEESVGGFVGKLDEGGVVSNCLHDAKVYNRNNPSGRWGTGLCYGTVKECCFFEGEESNDRTNVRIKEEDLASGLATFYLNGSVNKDGFWHQTIGKDPRPVVCLSDTAKKNHERVYAFLHCEPHLGYICTNSSEKPYEVHTFVDGRCTCGEVNGEKMVVERNGADWGLVCCPMQLNVSECEEGITLYRPVQVTTEGDKASLTVRPYASGEIIPAGTPVIYHLDASRNGYLRVQGYGKAYEGVGLTVGINNGWYLTGSVFGQQIRPTSFLTYFCPDKDKLSLVPYWTTSNDFEGYLVQNTYGGDPCKVKTVTFALEQVPEPSKEVPTGITKIDVNKGGIPDGPIYNLQGQRLSEPQHGQINIIGGKKVFVK